MKIPKCLLIITALATTACNSEEVTTGTVGDDTSTVAAKPIVAPLLATDLIYEKSGEGPDLWNGPKIRLALDPWLAKYPSIARDIRGEILDELLAEGYCFEADATACDFIINIQVQYRGVRLVSMIELTIKDMGENKKTLQATDRTYDLETGQKISFRDIFGSWPAARELLQRQLCEEMKQSAPCPSIDEQALVLHQESRIWGPDGASNVYVQRSGEAPGTYNEFQAPLLLTVTPELIALAKPEYRSYFYYADYSKKLDLEDFSVE